MPTALVNGFSLHWEEHGRGEPVVFLNGVMMTVRSWAAQLDFFASRYRCVMHDMRGQLLSAKPAGPYTMEQHAADLAGLLDQVGIDSCHLVGTSYGGEVGMIFAAEQPHRVRSLSVIASVAHVEPRLHDQVQAWADAAKRGPSALFDSVARMTYGDRFRTGHPDLLELAAERVRALPEEFFPAFIRLVEAFQRLDIRDRLAAITAPTLVVCGECDQLKPLSYGLEIVEGIPHAELLSVPGAGHAVVIEAADVVNTVLLGFITKHGDSL